MWAQQATRREHHSQVQEFIGVALVADIRLCPQMSLDRLAWWHLVGCCCSALLTGGFFGRRLLLLVLVLVLILVGKDAQRPLPEGASTLWGILASSRCLRVRQLPGCGSEGEGICGEFSPQIGGQFRPVPPGYIACQS